MYNIIIDYIGMAESDAKKVVLTCTNNDEGCDNFIFKTYKGGIIRYTNKRIIIPVNKSDLFLPTMVKEVIENAKTYVLRRRIKISHSFSIQI